MGGNGRHLKPLLAAGHDAVWLDFSRPAARIVAKRYPRAAALVADATHLPLRDASVDACLFVAGLHALPAADARAACLAELRRVLRPGGLAQVTVWSRAAPRFAAQGKPGEPLDVVLPWRSDGHDAPRHTFLYTAGALRADLEAAGFLVASEQAVSVVAPDDNLVAVVRRPA
jgi:SAM-dependent methyltransferase